MPRLTVAQVKASRIPQQINIASTDSRFIVLLNEAVEKLISRGHWLGTVVRCALTVTDQVVTLPPYLASIEKVAVSNSPIPIRSGYTEFIESGYGVRTSTTGLAEALRIPGMYPTSVDITAGYKVRVTCDLASDAAKTVVVHGTDSDGRAWRTTQSGVVAPGVALSIAEAGTTSAQTFNTITGITAPTDMDGAWWLDQIDPVTSAATRLSNYEWYEVAPGYTRYRIGNVTSATGTVEVIGRSCYVPVRRDNDFLLVSSVPALKFAMASIMAGERHDLEREAVLMALAVKELDYQIAHYNEADQPAVEVVGPLMGGQDPVEQFL